jgi:hypothetical protein
MTTIAQSGVKRRVLGGVDTHKDVHVVAVIDDVGRILGTASFPASGPGYRQLFGWLRGFGDVAAIGVEGCGSWGAGLARSLTARGCEWWRSTGRIVRTVAGEASPTRSTPKPQPGRCSPAMRP